MDELEMDEFPNYYEEGNAKIGIVLPLCMPTDGCEIVGNEK